MDKKRMAQQIIRGCSGKRCCQMQNKILYTTNAIEGFNRQLRKVTKAKSVFPTDDSLLKMLYLAMIDITKKWTGRRQDWSMIHAQLAVFFGSTGHFGCSHCQAPHSISGTMPSLSLTERTKSAMVIALLTNSLA